MSIARLAQTLCLMTVLGGTTALARADDIPAPATQPANDRPAPAGDPETIVQRLREQLSAMQLTDDQKQKIDDAMGKAEQSLKTLDSDLQNATQSQRAQHLRDIFDALREQVRSVLSPQQQQELRRKINGSVSNRLQRLRDGLSKIDLSADQKQKVKDLLEDARSKIEAARAGAADAGNDGAEKLREAGAELREKLGQILTDEQRQQLRDYMESSGATTSGATTQPQPSAK